MSDTAKTTRPLSAGWLRFYDRLMFYVCGFAFGVAAARWLHG